jgi:hypothetical protein
MLRTTSGIQIVLGLARVGFILAILAMVSKGLLMIAALVVGYAYAPFLLLHKLEQRSRVIRFGATLAICLILSLLAYCFHQLNCLIVENVRYAISPAFTERLYCSAADKLDTGLFSAVMISLMAISQMVSLLGKQR